MHLQEKRTSGSCPDSYTKDGLVAFRTNASKFHQDVQQANARVSLYLKIELLPPLHRQHLNAAGSRYFWRHMFMRLLVQTKSHVLRICKQTVQSSALMAH